MDDQQTTNAKWWQVTDKLYLSHNVALCMPHHEKDSKSTTLVVIGTDCTGSCKSNYHIYDHNHNGPHLKFKMGRFLSQIWKHYKNFRIQSISLLISTFVAYVKYVPTKWMVPNSPQCHWFLLKPFHFNLST